MILPRFFMDKGEGPAEEMVDDVDDLDFDDAAILGPSPSSFTKP